VAPGGSIWHVTKAARTLTCEEQSAACSRKGGGEACKTPSRLAECRKNGVWTGPSGEQYKAAR